MTQLNIVNRHADGSIDFDFYRTRSVALRRQAMREGSVLGQAFKGALVMAGVIGVVFLLAPLPRQGTGDVTVADAKTHPAYCSHPEKTGSVSTPCWPARSAPLRQSNVIAEATTPADPL